MQHHQDRKENDMSKSTTKRKPKTLTQVSGEFMDAKKASKERIKRNPVQGNIQKSARVAAQKRKKAATNASKRFNKGTAR
jgi:hypothetical protein